ncbi:uncharacterized protein LOC143908534 [Temnothorax americanus]|uniref:uncharacterized protein LOC143908534 n=1 Tax=Temnothorax americanus TaxID=1964332 RepID=UPI004067D331
MGDWEGEFTYVDARGSLVIDYIIVNGYVHDKVLEFKVDDRVDSDHLPLAMEMEGIGRQVAEEGEEKDEEQNIVRKIINWDRDARRLYDKRTMELGGMEWQKSWAVEEKWSGIKELIHRALIYKEVKKSKRKEIGHKDWWNRSCTKKKWKYRKWKKGKSRRFINRQRKKEWTENNIQGEEWRKHFMMLLGDTEKEIIMKKNGTLRER